MIFLIQFTEEPFAGLYAHELSGKKETKETGSQTENWENNNPLFESLLHGLEEIVHTGLTAQSWEDRTAELEPEETESSDSSHSASSSDEPGQVNFIKESGFQTAPVVLCRSQCQHIGEMEDLIL